MPAKILVHSPDREVATLFASLLQQYHHQTWCADSIEISGQIARRTGPMDLVLCLDDRGPAAELRAELRAVSPDTRFLQLPPLRGASVPASDLRLDSPGALLEAAELMEMVLSVLEAAEHGSGAAPVTVEGLREALSETILTFLMLLEPSDELSVRHTRLVQDHSARIARELGLSAVHADEIGFAALLQDIGLVRRPGSTDDAAGADVREHPIRSANLIQRMKLPWKIRHIVLAHHEWYNGRGYPQGLKGREIPLGARILAVGNAWFSMTNRRGSRPALDEAAALDELQRHAGRQFDPEVVELFLALTQKLGSHRRDSERRVLVVSADAAFADLARSRFEAAGSASEAVAGGMEALARLRSTAPDAILLDLELQDMSGLQLLHWIKADPDLAVLPLVALSGDPDHSTHAFMAHDMGADDFLAKPVRATDLVARVNAVLRRRDRLARAEFSRIHDGEGLRGNLDELAIPDLVAMLHEGRKTATVQVFLPEGVATLAFDGGQIVHARAGNETGEAAVKRIFRARVGDFLIEHGAATAERTIERHMNLLVSEALAERDAETSSPGPVATPSGSDTTVVVRSEASAVELDASRPIPVESAAGDRPAATASDAPAATPEAPRFEPERNFELVGVGVSLDRGERDDDDGNDQPEPAPLLL